MSGTQLQRSHTCAVEEYYDVEGTVAAIREGDYKRVALQFPDEMLPDAVEIVAALQASVGEGVRVFILGDTTFGSCCVDEVAAEHYGADFVVHYGPTCLSVPSRLPAYLVFGRQPVDVAGVVGAVTAGISDLSTRTVVLLRECAYEHSIAAISEALGRVAHRVIVPTTHRWLKPDMPAAPEGTLRVGGMLITLPEGVEWTACTMLYVGAEGPRLGNILLRCGLLSCWIVNPVTNTCTELTGKANNSLMKRYHYIGKVAHANIIGLVAGTMGVSHYQQVLATCKRLIRAAGKACYTMVVGKLKPEKLGNFPMVEAYVMIACPESTVVESRDYFVPIVTPFELALALSDTLSWTGDYRTDFEDLLPLLARAASAAEAAQGASTEELVDESKDAAEGSGAMTVRNQHTELTAYHSVAADYLRGLEFQGLDPRIGQTPVAKVEPGMYGIAAGYTRMEEAAASKPTL